MNKLRGGNSPAFFVGAFFFRSLREGTALCRRYIIGFQRRWLVIKLYVSALVAVDKAAISFDKPYSYLVPAELIGQVQPGCRVLVPFGSGNKKRQGIVLEIESLDSPGKRMKYITQLIDESPLLSPQALQMVEWLKSYVLCTYYEAVRLMIPPGIDRSVVTSYTIGEVPLEEKRDFLSDAICEYLRQKKEPVSEQDLLALGERSAVQKTLDTLSEAGILFKSFDTIQKVNDETVRMVRLSEDAEQKIFALGSKITSKQHTVIEVLGEVQAASFKELCYLAGVTRVVVQNLEKRGIVESFENKVYRSPYRMLPQGKESLAEVTLNEEQKAAFETLKTQCEAGQAAVSLLYGVTGSGKTLVFLKLMEYVLSLGKTVIVMVPEISLTPQTVQRFRKYFGSRVAVLHSGLSLGERLDEWRRLKEGKADIAIGTRSAVFAPLENVGLIIMDEEQESSYQSESSPRYHARDVAKYRAAAEHALLLLCSATPSIDSFYRAKNGIYTLVTLKKRYNQKKLPDVYVVDMGEEAKNGNRSAYSSVLLYELRYNLNHGEQSILLLNRRGYNTIVACAECGEVCKCPHCSIAMTYHRQNGKLMCHYCGYIEDAVSKCPTCGSEFVQYTGLGTQKAEEELQQIFPEARILRMDADTTISKFSHEQYFKEFADKKYDIMIGTQMVAKGLDFENVTLVGVLSLDQALYAQDYKAYERAFSLLTQVVGRCGRASLLGRAFVQTYTPDNSIIALAAKQDYDRFYVQEIASRRALLYPPFCDLCTVGFSGIYENEVVQAAFAFAALLRELVQRSYPDVPLKMLGPVSERIVKLNNKYRYKLVIKCKNNRRMRALLLDSMMAFEKDKSKKNISIYVTMNQE